MKSDVTVNAFSADLIGKYLILEVNYALDNFCNLFDSMAAGSSDRHDLRRTCSHPASVGGCCFDL